MRGVEPSINTRNTSMYAFNSNLLRLLRLVDSVPWPKPPRRRGRPYVYPFVVLLKCFVVMVWQRIDSNRGLHAFLTMDKPYPRVVCEACGLSQRMPSRRTLDRRLKAMPPMLKASIRIMAKILCVHGLVDPLIMAMDSSLLAAKGPVWHKSSMERGEAPCPGIDTDARWGKSGTKGWVFGYKASLASSTMPIVAPLSADLTTANVPDNLVYPDLTEDLPGDIGFMATDTGCDDGDLRALSMARGWVLVTPVKRCENTPPERLILADFYESEAGQAIYGLRGVTVEPLIGQIKDVFGLDPLPVRGFKRVSALYLLCVLAYQLALCLNHLESRPPRDIKHLLTT